MSKARVLSLLVAAPLALAACSRPGRAPSGGSARVTPAAAPGASPAGVVAEVNGTPITAAELEERAAARLGALRQEEYEIRKQALDDLIAERLIAAEAARRGISPAELERQEVDARAGAPPDSQVDSIYEENKARFGGQTRAEAIARIRDVLAQRARAERRAAWETELRGGARVAVHLAAPRAAVTIPAGTPSTGPASAPVTIVEFTDYQCPYCHRAQSVIEEVLSRYSGRVRLVHLDFPLDGHPAAFPAARAARCAAEQDRFWEYHRNLMTAPGTLDAADLAARAAALGMDVRSFGACVASGRHDSAIRASLREGQELGVSGTPAYFVNGRMLSGARPIESFAEVIDAELAGG